ncbi:MAG TPA: sigma 54-interacting transcriptional regulator [Burkholderiales bacterium]|nr:sigma 54-interacting transcriptional regulator [Burkholderiales bacterium]
MAAQATQFASEWRREIVTRSPAMERVLARARLSAAGDAGLLLQGASGTGKRLLARAVHAASARFGRPFVALHCGALPEPLLESELFGHVKGAFPGAVHDHAGLLQSAQGGTLFLAEVSELPLALQAKLLRALQERQARAVGATQALPIDVRVIAGTRRELAEEMAAGRFRAELYYHLNTVTLALPPLAERREDVAPLAAHFLAAAAERCGKRIEGIAPAALPPLRTAPWPGNVRQLREVIERCVAQCGGRRLSAALVTAALAPADDDFAALDAARREFESEYLTRLLRITDGNVAQAAKLAKRQRADFLALLARYALDPKAFKPL